jgi:hypothetical protein
MNPIYRPIRIVALAFACALTPQAKAAEPKLPRDGWVSWQLPTVDDAPAWCCFNGWSPSDASRTACKIDAGRDGYNIRDKDETTDAVKVYVRSTGGKIDRLQVLSAACPVETRTPVQQLGDVSNDDSARWLIARVRQEEKDVVTDRPIAEHALAALAMHRGELAGTALNGFARDPRTETRKKSVFWLSILRGEEGAETTSQVMFNDEDADVREHAAFALSQSKSPRVAPDLIRLGNTDKEGDVRAKAWFSLALTRAPAAESAIAAALRKDADEDVREQAIFALSQLPDERGTRALIAVAEDQSLSREQRKRAIFWLSHSESDSAQAYLEKVLARAAR